MSENDSPQGKALLDRLTRLLWRRSANLRSSSTSLFEPDWAWALYLAKGATGIGQKRFAQFSVWAVATFDPA